MASDVTPLASLSLTHVAYDPNDPLSLAAAYLSLLPQALMIVYATLLFSTREAEIALMFAGQLACEALNFVLKRLIKQDRPRHIHQSNTKGYGMPSSHAQFVCFWAVALSLVLLVRHRPTFTKKDTGPRGLGELRVRWTEGGVRVLSADIERYAHAPWGVWQRGVVSAGAVAVAGLVAWSRIYLGYHTPTQVFAGCTAGTLCGVGWFAVTWVVRETGLLRWALQVPVARWFRLRDLLVEEDLCQAGWEKWESRREAREKLEGEKKKR
ncbi:hypothetical protein OQA88_1891 [Cercophora sp. LCS_1]